MRNAFSYGSGQFPARVLGSRTVAGFVCTETDYLPGQSIGRHLHSKAGLVAVLWVGFTESLGSRQFVCEPMGLLYREPGDLHSDLFGNVGGKCLTIEIPRAWQGRVRGVVPESTTLIGQAPPTLDASVIRLYREFLENDQASSLALEGLILEIIACAARHLRRPAAKRDGKTAEKAREMIHERWPDGLSLSAIAEDVGVHPSHLARAFREEYGVTVGDYLRGLRIRRSARELTESGKPLSRIAADCGFADQSHFTRTFKKPPASPPSRTRETSGEVNQVQMLLAFNMPRYWEGNVVE